MLDAVNDATTNISAVAAAGEDLYRIHPFLDPRLPSRRPALARLWLATYRRCLEDPILYSEMLGSYAHPIGRRGDTMAVLSRYFQDADAYLDDLLRLVPHDMANQMRCLPDTQQANDMLHLLRSAFEGDGPRRRFEAQRKLYLSKLLFDVDHCRTVHDGPRHKNKFESILQDNLWTGLVGGSSIEVCCRFEQDREEDGLFLVGASYEPGAVCWRFQVRKLPAKNGDPEIEIYHYRSRFKREANPGPSHRTDNGFLALTESPRWPGLGRRSGSIVSKMLRRGIGDPRMVEDLLGAMFIVGNRRQAYALERRLVHLLGGPLRWRRRVDTLGGEKERGELNARSSSGFRVLKGIVDVLTEEHESAAPYFFPVEVQIFPVENYLRTLHAESFASHYAYKKRQFLHDLLPLLYPSAIYGKETAHLAAESK